jgi:arylsulfatase A-like enzyme
MKAIVLQINGLGANWLGAYGNEWVETFHLDRLAAESVVFDSHFSDRPHPDRAWKSLWTGKYSFAGSGERPEGSPPPPAGFDGKVRTILIHDRETPPFPIDAWDIVLEALPDEDETPDQAFIATLEAGLDFLDEQEDGLLWIETNLLLPPWPVEIERFKKFSDPASEPIPDDEPEDDGDLVEDEGELVEETEIEEEEEEEAEEIDEQPPEDEPELYSVFDPPVGPFQTDDPEEWDFLHASFAAMVNEFDDTFETLVEMFREHGLDESAVWVITSNCGQALGEHGIVGQYRPWLHEELVHLPLIVRFPNAEQAGRRVFALTQPVDVLPTLLDQFAIPIPETVHGRSLLPLARNETDKVRDYAVSGHQLGAAKEYSLRTPERYLILPIYGEIDDAPRPPMLFEKPKDRCEVNDLRQHFLDWSDSAEKVLKEFVERSAQEQFEAPPLES